MFKKIYYTWKCHEKWLYIENSNNKYLKKIIIELLTKIDYKMNVSHQ